MTVSEGYRLKARNVAEVSAVLEVFRAQALRILARRYGSMVARAAVSEVDLTALGVLPGGRDPIAAAREAIMAEQGGPVPHPGLNCAVDLCFVGDAVLARFAHGDENYRKAWEAVPGVVKWGKPGSGDTGASAEARRRYWDTLAERRGMADGLKFVLLGEALPRIGWGGIRHYLPLFDERLKSAAIRLAEAEKGLPQHLALERAKAALEKDLTKESFAATTPARRGSAPRSGPVPSAPAAPAASAADRMRKEAAKARRERSAAPAAEQDGRASSIDHADVVVSSDGRTFVAAPYVGLDVRNRVFLQVGDSHVAVSQGGVQFGYVTGVQKSAIDHLRHCRTVTLVEVERRDGRRLLRARHVAIVSDISLGESVNVALGGFRRPKATAGDREIREWDSRD